MSVPCAHTSYIGAKFFPKQVAKLKHSLVITLIEGHCYIHQKIVIFRFGMKILRTPKAFPERSNLMISISP